MQQYPAVPVMPSGVLLASNAKGCAYVLGSIAAAKVFREKKRPNIIFWSSAGVPAPCFTDFGRDHS